MWFVPLAVFEKEFGHFRVGILRGAPLHSTVHISPWGLQTEFAESHLVKDMALAFNEATENDEVRLAPHRQTSWAAVKASETRAEIAELSRRRDANERMCILACFNLVEAYINGLAWDYAQTHDLSCLSRDDRNVLTESDRPVNIITKLIRIPRLVSGQDGTPLHQTREPLKSFIEIVKPYRDAIVHASPFAAPEKFGGYDKLSKLYGLDLATVRTAVDITVEMIKQIHQFVGGSGALPPWFLERKPTGKFNFDSAG